MNPANADFSNRSASSPALFNRCVIDWFGDWADEGLLQVAMEFTKYLDIQSTSFTKTVDMPGGESRVDPKHELVSQCIVQMHMAVRDTNLKLSKAAKKFNFITPRDFLNFIKQFIALYAEKKGNLEEQQDHLQVGITKLKNTEQSVAELSQKLKSYDIELKNKKD
jgi:dynein heavy chain 1